jgi:glycine cleavage system aminomethyltransferase T
MGWLLPSHYGDVQTEVAAARQGVGLADISPFSKLQYHDPGLDQLVSGLIGDGSAAKPGGVMVLHGPDPGLACRLTKRSLLILSSSLAGVSIAVGFPPQTIPQARDVTMSLAGFVVVGPGIDLLLPRLTGFDLSVNSLPPGRCAETKLAEVHALLVRPPESALSELRIYIAADVGEYVWETVLLAGRDMGIVPLGLESLAALGFPQCL